MTLHNVVQGQRLTDHEIKFINLLAQAKNIKQMANELELSQDTVRWHIKKINRKLGTSGQLELLVRCIETGIVTIPRKAENHGETPSRTDH